MPVLLNDNFFGKVLISLSPKDYSIKSLAVSLILLANQIITDKVLKCKIVRKL